MSVPKTLNIMIQKLILILVISFLLTACTFDNSSMNEKDVLQIKSTLENLALDNLKDWEPPFNEDKFLQDFSQSDDFHYNTPAIVTAVYRLEDNNWRIVNSHVSHGENKLLKE